MRAPSHPLLWEPFVNKRLTQLFNFFTGVFFKRFCGIIRKALNKEERMKRGVVIVGISILFLAAMTLPVLAEEKSSSDFLVDALIGAGEGAIVGEASGGKAGKGALIGAGTALGREVIVKPMLKGGLQGPGQATVPQSQQVVTHPAQPMDPYSRGYQDGFKDGYNEGYKAGLAASQR